MHVYPLHTHVSLPMVYKIQGFWKFLVAKLQVMAF